MNIMCAACKHKFKITTEEFPTWNETCIKCKSRMILRIIDKEYFEHEKNE